MKNLRKFRRSSAIVIPLFVIWILVSLYYERECERIEKNLPPTNAGRFVHDRKNVSVNAARSKDQIVVVAAVDLEFDPLMKIDWQDKVLRMENKERVGNGEHGKAATLPPDHDKERCDVEKTFKRIGYNGCLSDYVSVNRSVPDFRPQGCRNKKYRCSLPKVSIIIPIHNEHWSVLLRAIHSILNRAPPELVEEMILIDDGSTETQMKKQLDDYVASSVPKARVFHLPAPRKGLMGARLFGARNATGDVLLFLDSNIEANVNWLPPLLEPIAENYKTCVCPIIDFININTFALRSLGQGTRIIFGWDLYFSRSPLLPEDRADPSKPFKNPAMIGCAFAISSRFFWELGGYDPGLQIWGGEQFELSFKVWLCGGVLLDAPCSRVAHLYRAMWQPFKNPGVGDYLGRNSRRVADVWMDEYAQYVYEAKPHYRKIDPGDLSKQRELRKRLQCKPFKWYMEEVAFDVLKRYPVKEPPPYGSGKIVPILDDQLCLTAIKSNKSTALRDCTGTLQQEFILGGFKNIRVGNESSDCLDVHNIRSRAPIFLYRCTRRGMHQLWRYNLKTQQFNLGLRTNLCLDHDAKTKDVFVETCNETSRTQKWKMDTVNADALKRWKETPPVF